MSIRFAQLRPTLLLPLALLYCGGLSPAQTPDALRAGFAHPPQQARPLVWWYWMNGNITEAGIKLDLKWMHRIGLGGFQTFDASLATPLVVDRRLSYMTPEWDKAFLYASRLGEQLGMEEAIASSPGWSETGGPWVQPKDGMKKYVWSELRVSGGRPLAIAVPHPPQVTGPFQSMPLNDTMSAASRSDVQFYADTKVLAFRAPAGDALGKLSPAISASSGKPDFRKLDDDDLASIVELPIPEDGGIDPWIQYDFHQPTTIRTLQFAVRSLDEISAFQNQTSNPDVVLQCSDDGENFHDVLKAGLDGSPRQTLSFEPATGRFFRVAIRKTPIPPPPAWLVGLDVSALGFTAVPKKAYYEVAELKLISGERINHLEEKAAFALIPDVYRFPTPASADSEASAKSGIVDLTTKMKPDGTLDWTPPAGEWIILRFGYSLTGITNHPATREATGLEVDKMDRSAVERYMTHYLDSYKSIVGPEHIGHHGIQAVVTDSWEAGPQNWTPDLLDEFKRRRGYDAVPWMPVLAGYVVESAKASDAFLWDFRKTIEDLHADIEYGQVQQSLAARGIRHYGESHEAGRALVADGMEVKKLDDIPMSAMWVQSPGVNTQQFGFDADDRESASVGHIYGKPVVAAESMTAATAAWQWTPSSLRPTADQELINGINRFVIHESTHQPIVSGKAPGLTLGPFGQWFNRNETWAEEAGPWITYLARGSYLMQQGLYAADILYFYGEDSNLTALFSKSAPDVPEGYGFDYTNADALIHRFHVDQGHIVTDSGMNYRLLALDPYSTHMSLPVLKAIRQLVVQGAVVVGERPVEDVSLADDPTEFRAIRDGLFGESEGMRTVGKGKVFSGWPLQAALDELHLHPDFSYSKPDKSTKLEFAHRHLPEGEIYFVSNRTPVQQDITAGFRTAGRVPELWHADTGKIEPAAYRASAEDTTVPLELEPWGSVFVVFRKAATAPQRVISHSEMKTVAALDRDWTIRFQPGRGAPSSASFPQLANWTANSNTGVRYFSGTATYRKTIVAQSGWFKHGTRLQLDLGDVRELAHVRVNGKDLGTLWHAPFLVDVTGAMKPGANEISIEVTNTWVNRLIGDLQPNTQERYTYADFKPYRTDSPLLPSGLLGPVRLQSSQAQ